MVYLRHPSRVLPQNEAPFPPLLGIVAAQLKVTPAVWTQYARRDETRREHLQELLYRFELRQFNRTDFRALIEWLLPLALQTTQGMLLAHAVANELRSRKILLPTVALIEQICAIALTPAERETFRRLTAGLTDAHRAALDGVLLVRPGGVCCSAIGARRRCLGYRPLYSMGGERTVAAEPASTLLLSNGRERRT